MASAVNFSGIVRRCFKFQSSCSLVRNTSFQQQLYHRNNLLRLTTTIRNRFVHSDAVEQNTTQDPSPLEHDDYFDIKTLPTVEDLYKARVHFGHAQGNRHEHMKPYLFGCRMGIDIIDLDQTLVHMQLALNFLAHMAYRRAVILFILQSSQHGHQVEKAARDCGEYSHTREWSSGLFTNAKFGEASSNRYPDVCVFLSTMSGSYQEHPAVAECAKVGIATVGVVDSNVNPSIVTYPIPGNDDSTASITHYLDLFSRAITAGKVRREIHDLMGEQKKLQESSQENSQENRTEDSSMK